MKTETVGDRIKEALFMRGMSQADLCHKSGIERGHISNITTGRIKYPRKHLSKIADALDVCENWLLTGQKNDSVRHNQYPIFSLVDNQLEEVGAWHTEMSLSGDLKIIDAGENLLIIADRLGEGPYLFHHLGALVTLYRHESLAHISWYPLQFDDSYTLIGKIISTISKELIDNETIKTCHG
ncbi:helix-turn-helix domain-containing protein [Vibrio sp. S4M6]|uniref:helix-turn-helix domain-containing protein n=1 Tax=Vibrio sinus TaxID=2946865 RepID=UPI00202A7903|nr:helix-turn-helix domain-containing protein [Vibrio sinus]MCL9782910.1 helix-turn-helix domain-containing protein [Vibrio sinus]